jgi:hypothetical protein
MEGCAPSMGASLWGARPLWEYRLGLIVSKDNHEPKARAMSRGVVWRKPECKRCEATDRNRIQGRGLRGELAHDSKAHRYAACGKCGACAPTVRVPYLGRSASRAVRVDGGKSRTVHTGSPRTRRCGELPAACDEPAASTIEAHSATCGNARRDGAEVSRRRSRRPGVGPLKG